jgi:hypothetical protein
MVETETEQQQQATTSSSSDGAATTIANATSGTTSGSSTSDIHLETNVDPATLNPLSPEVISRQATINIGGLAHAQSDHLI